jgi:phosphate transport system permease protein
MTDRVTLQTQTAAAFDFTSDAAKRRVRRRYRSERRFKVLAMSAVAFAGLFLILLLSNIITKSLPAFTHHSVALNVPVTPEMSMAAKDPSAASAIDLRTTVRKSIETLAPEATSRAQRKDLHALFSSSSEAVLRQAYTQKSSSLPQSLPLKVMLSAEADLYLKGEVSPKKTIQGRSSLQISKTENGTVKFVSPQAEFTQPLARIKSILQKRALDARDQAQELDGILKASLARELEARNRLATVGSSGSQSGIDKALLNNQLLAAEAERKAIEIKYQDANAQASSLEARALSSNTAEILSSDLPSILIKVSGTWAKIEKLGPYEVEVAWLGSPLEKGESSQWQLMELSTPEANRKLSDQQLAWIESMVANGIVSKHFNTVLFTNGDSREPEQAGVLGAIIGSFWTMLVTLVICLPLGVAAAIYLEEFAPKNAFTEIIEVNINNLAAVPSIVFGLLGLAVFLNAFNMPRSAPLVGGLVLALLVLPTIIIASRAALKAVPPSIREAALGVGATHQQAIFHHVLPLAMPGIMTGAIIGMAHALGETAPLLMIGMVAFIVDIPGHITDAATALPVQIYLWSDLPERAFEARTAAAIVVLLAFLLAMNSLAVYMRKRFERRW